MSGGGETAVPVDSPPVADFFVFRTPLLPYEELEAWAAGIATPTTGNIETGPPPPTVAADRTLLRERLAAILARPEILEAIYVASPSLSEGIDVWRARPDSKKGLRAERALVRYLVRMAVRPTPFGLFSGCSVGMVSAAESAARLVLVPRDRYRRHTRLDMDYLFALSEDLARDGDLSAQLPLRLNSSLYRAAGRYRYAEARREAEAGGRLRTYHLVAVEVDDFVEVAVETARGGTPKAAVAAAVAARDADGEVTQEEAAAYVDELVASQILMPELAPRVTADEATIDLAEALEAHPAGAGPAARLRATEEALRRLDAAGLGNDPERYREVAGELARELPTEIEPSRLFQTDMVKPAPGSVLGGEVIDELLRGVGILHRLFGGRWSESLDRFRNDLVERYGESQPRPLVEVLDEEVGLGFERAEGVGTEASPLVAGLAFPPVPRPEQTAWDRRHAFLLRRLEELALDGAIVLELTAAEIDELAVAEPAPLPAAFHAMATLAAASEEAVIRGEFRLHLRGAGGPSGARLLGRFCHADAELEAGVRRHLAAEEAVQPDAVFAEIVHLPQGRIGNILARPRLRRYEIPFLGRAAVAEEHQIAVDDLLVSAEGGRIVLTSRRLGREVVPRLTTAHNFVRRSLGLYRFLCALQGQGVAGGLGWSWGALESAPFLPRVAAGRLVLSRAQWTLSGEELRALGDLAGPALLTHLRDLRRRRRLPRLAVWMEADNELLVDFENVLLAESFADAVKRRPAAVLVELFPGPDELWARGPEGRFTHEILVPFTRSSGPQRAARALSPAAGETDFPPGSRWLYAKLYTGTATADAVLRDEIAPLVRGAVASGDARSWFFLRYGDPEWHLRLRIEGDPERLAAVVRPALETAAARLLDDGQLHRFQFDTYRREVVRYGGPAGIGPSEELFWADSEAVLAIVETLEGDEGADARWRLALRGADMLLDDLGLDLEAKRALAARLREGYTREFRADLQLKRQLGDRYRRERPAIEALLGRDGDETSPLAPGIEAFARRSAQGERAASELRRLAAEGSLQTPLPEIAASLVHMHVNRLIRAEARAHELVLYEFLFRHYNARRARRNT